MCLSFALGIQASTQIHQSSINILPRFVEQHLRDQHNLGLQTYLLTVTPSGQGIKCHCNQITLYCVTVFRHILLQERPIENLETCHCNQMAVYCVSETSVTLSEEVCIVLTAFLCSLTFRRGRSWRGGRPSSSTSCSRPSTPLRIHKSDHFIT